MLLFLLIIGTLASGVLVVFSVMGTALSVMVFDAPGAVQNPVAWAFFCTVALVPLCAAAGPIAAWIAYTRDMDWHALAFLALPLAPLTVLGVLAVANVDL